MGVIVGQRCLSRKGGQFCWRTRAMDREKMSRYVVAFTTSFHNLNRIRNWVSFDRAGAESQVMSASELGGAHVSGAPVSERGLLQYCGLRGLAYEADAICNLLRGWDLSRF